MRRDSANRRMDIQWSSLDLDLTSSHTLSLTPSREFCLCTNNRNRAQLKNEEKNYGYSSFPSSRVSTKHSPSSARRGTTVCKVFRLKSTSKGDRGAPGNSLALGQHRRSEQTSPLFMQQIRAFATVERLVLRTVMQEMGAGIVIEVLFFPLTCATKASQCIAH